MGAIDSDRIQRMQDNLAVIRSVARWTTERLGEEIGVSRQTVHNLERGKTAMTKTQYLALRAVFNNEAAESNNQALAQIIRSLVDEPIEDEADDSASAANETSSTGTMNGMSVVTRVLSDKKTLALVTKAIAASAIPGAASLIAASAIWDAANSSKTNTLNQ